MKQKQEHKTPIELSKKRKQAYKRLMKNTAEEPIVLPAAFNLLSEVYETKHAKKKCLQEFDKNPNIPLDFQDRKVINTV